MQARVHDASRDGLRIEIRGSLIEVGSTAVVELPKMSGMTGQVVWSRGSQVGIRLSRPLTSAAAIALVIEDPAAP
jgi:hypothetical protein